MNKKLILTVSALAMASMFALSAFADDGNHATTSPNPRHTPTPVDITCVQTAVNTRETTLDTGFDTLTASIKSAYTARKAALNTAWGMSDAKARRASIRIAFSDFRTNTRKARQAWTTTRIAAWNQFSTARRACPGGNAASAPEENRGADASI